MILIIIIIIIIIIIVIIIIIIIIIKDHDDRKSLYSISRQSLKFSRELRVPAIPLAEDEAHTTYARRTKATAKLTTRVTNSSGPSGNQNHCTANNHSG